MRLVFAGTPHPAADTVLALHLLEHLDPEHGDRVLTEAVRLARRRVIVAVPLEDEADETWGHVRTVTLDDLDTWGRRTGLPYAVTEDHGGWLVVDLPADDEPAGGMHDVGVPTAIPAATGRPARHRASLRQAEVR